MICQSKIIVKTKTFKLIYYFYYLLYVYNNMDYLSSKFIDKINLAG